MTKHPALMKVSCDQCGGTGKIEVSSLAYLRKKAGLDQTEVGERLGLTRTSISNIERGEQAISIDKIQPLAEIYGITEFEMYEAAKALAKVRPELNKEA